MLPWERRDAEQELVLLCRDVTVIGSSLLELELDCFFCNTTHLNLCTTLVLEMCLSLLELKPNCHCLWPLLYWNLCTTSLSALKKTKLRFEDVVGYLQIHLCSFGWLCCFLRSFWLWRLGLKKSPMLGLIWICLALHRMPVFDNSVN